MVQVKPMEYKLLIDGQWVQAKSGDYFDVENPANGETVARMANGEQDDVAEAISSSELAFLHDRWRPCQDSLEDWRDGGAAKNGAGPPRIDLQWAPDIRNFVADAGGGQLLPILRGLL